MRNIRGFISENFQFLEVNFSRYLNRRVFVMGFVVLGFGSLLSSLLCFITVSVIICVFTVLLLYADRTYVCNFELHQNKGCGFARVKLV